MADKEIRIGDITSGSIPNPDLRFAIDGSGNAIVDVPNGVFGDGTEDLDFATYTADVLQFDDTATSPTTNGEFRLNGTDVEVFSGGSTRSLSNIGGGDGVDVEDDTTLVVSNATAIDFGTNLGVTDDGDQTVTVDGTDTRTDVSDSGVLSVSDVTDINFDTDLSVTDDGDGTVTVDNTGGGGGGADDSRVQMFARRRVIG